MKNSFTAETLSLRRDTQRKALRNSAVPLRLCGEKALQNLSAALARNVMKKLLLCIVLLSASTFAQNKGVLLEDLTWQEAEKVLKPETVVVIPLGAQSKEHGPHLKLKNDWTMAEFYKQRVRQAANVVIAPTINYHFYPAFVEYPGSTTLRLETARDLVIDICRGLARFGPRRFYLINTGVSTLRALKPAAETLAAEGIVLHYLDVTKDVEHVSKPLMKQEGGTHADEIETSKMLYIDPASVEMRKAVKDYTPRPNNSRGLTRDKQAAARGEGTYSPTGAWGDPTLATREKGKIITEATVSIILKQIETLRQTAPPKLESRKTMFQHEYADINGLKLHCVKEGSGPQTILFLHGFPEFWYEWKNQLKEFGKDYTAVAYDQRGYNLSSKPEKLEDYAVPHIVADIKAMFEKFGTNANNKGILVAHDWGGAVAWAFAIRYPEYLDKLVIINAPHPGVFARELQSNPEQQKASAYMNFFRSAQAEAGLSANNYALLQNAIFKASTKSEVFSDDDKKMYVEAWSQPGALTGGLNWYRAAQVGPPTGGEGERTQNIVSGLDALTVKVPTLVIWGEKDTALLTGNLEGLDKFVPQLTIKRLPNGSHWVIHEEPELVNQYIREFIKK
jgi:pimeloyl-ACP methyl ester carboxylesterase/creatinine amidohydrolase/Fe(II)-dependent formamide hydrolase-like protein